MEIKNYKLKDFLQQPIETVEQYAQLLQYLKPIPTKNKLQDLKFGEVEFIKRNLGNEQSLQEIFEYMEGVNEKGFYNLPVTTFYGILNDIKRQVENLIQIEEEHLNPAHTNAKWEMVEGNKRLGVMGSLPTIDKLAGGDILKYDEVLELPYMTCFNKLKLEKINSDLEHEINDLYLKENS